MADHAVSEALYLTDPDGLGIEVYADRPRGSWTHPLEWELVVPDADEATRVARRIGGAGYAVADAGPSWLASDPWGTRVSITGGQTPASS